MESPILLRMEGMRILGEFVGTWENRQTTPSDSGQFLCSVGGKIIFWEYGNWYEGSRFEKLVVLVNSGCYDRAP